MAKRKGNTDSARKIGATDSSAARGKDSRTLPTSRVYGILTEGLRKIDDLADFIKAALLDMDTGSRPPVHTGHCLNAAGKLIQLKKMQDQQGVMAKKAQGDPSQLPGTDRRIA